MLRFSIEEHNMYHAQRLQTTIKNYAKKHYDLVTSYDNCFPPIGSDSDRLLSLEGIEMVKEFLAPILDVIRIDMMGHDGYNGYNGYMTVNEYDDVVDYNKICDLLEYDSMFSEELVSVLLMYIKALKEGRDHERLLGLCIKAGKYVSLMGNDYRCSVCGKRIEVGLNLATLILSPYKDYDYRTMQFVDSVECCLKGINSYEFDFEVVSGKVVFTNSVYQVLTDDKRLELTDQCRTYMKENGDGSASINSVLGQILNAEFYAKMGILHIQCGNVSPSMYLHNNGIVIGHDIQGGDCIGNICTDLWAVTAMDYDVVTEYLTQSGQHIDCLNTYYVVDMVPGWYVVSVFTDESDVCATIIRKG